MICVDAIGDTNGMDDQEDDIAGERVPVFGRNARDESIAIEQAAAR